MVFLQSRNFTVHKAELVYPSPCVALLQPCHYPAARQVDSDTHQSVLAWHPAYVLQQCPSLDRIATCDLSVCVCRRPTFSETKRVLYSLLSVFEPSSHALQALNAPARPAVPKPPKHSPQKAPAVVAEPEPDPVKVSRPLPVTVRLCMGC